MAARNSFCLLGAVLKSPSAAVLLILGAFTAFRSAIAVSDASAVQLLNALQIAAKTF